MKMRLVLLVLALGLSSCAGKHALPMPEGDWHPLNAGKWDFNSNMLTTAPVTAQAPPSPDFGGYRAFLRSDRAPEKG